MNIILSKKQAGIEMNVTMHAKNNEIELARHIASHAASTNWSLAGDGTRLRIYGRFQEIRRAVEYFFPLAAIWLQ